MIGSPDSSDSQFSCTISPEVLIQMCTKGFIAMPEVCSYYCLDNICLCNGSQQLSFSNV